MILYIIQYKLRFPFIQQWLCIISKWEKFNDTKNNLFTGPISEHFGISERLSLRKKIGKMITIYNIFKWHKQQIKTSWGESWGVIAVHYTGCFCGLKAKYVCLMAPCRLIIAEFLFRHWILEKKYENYFIGLISIARNRCILGGRSCDYNLFHPFTHKY